MKHEVRSMKHEAENMMHEARSTKQGSHHASCLLRRASSAFTLIELVLSIALIGVLAGLVGPMLTGGVRSYGLVAKRKAALAETRVALDRMTSEIVLIPSTASIDTWTSSVFQFDIAAESNVQYALNGTTLERSAVTLATDISSLTFSYLDLNGNTAAAVGDIKRIRIEMKSSAGSAYGTLTVRDAVFPRGFASRYAGFE